MMPIEYKVARWRVAIRISIEVLYVAIILLALLSLPGRILMPDPATRFWTTGIIAAYFIVTTLRKTVSLLFREFALRMQEDGVVDQANRLGLMRWANIQSIRRCSRLGHRCLEITLRDPQAWVNNFRLPRRATMYLAVTLGLKPLIVLTWINADGDQLKEDLDGRIAAAG
jgi:hypothetical protein